MVRMHRGGEGEVGFWTFFPMYVVCNEVMGVENPNFLHMYHMDEPLRNCIATVDISYVLTVH